MGVDTIMSQGTFGEGASITWQEQKKMLEVMVDTAKNRVPVFAGTTTLNTRDTKIDPEFHKAFWSPCACTGPELTVYIRDTVRKARDSRDWSVADEIYPQIVPILANQFPPVGFLEFSRYNIQLEKERFNTGGWINAGHCRPPYNSAPESYLEGARKAGRGWAELNEKLKNGQFGVIN